MANNDMIEKKVSPSLSSECDVASALRDARVWLKQHTTSHHSNMTIMRPQRVNQLDAIELDGELSRVLSESTASCIGSFANDNMVHYLMPETHAFVRLIMFCLSIGVERASPGNKLQNLCYAPSSVFQKSMYFVWSVALPYFHDALNRRMLHSDWSMITSNTNVNVWCRPIYLCVRRIEIAHSVLTILNFLSFLRGGIYRSLLDRLTCMSLRYARADASRHVAFDHMNQQLMCQGLSDFVLFVWPLMNTQALRSKLRLTLRRFLRRNNDGNSECGICGTSNIIVRSISSCNHIFCYYCLRASRLAAHDNFTCPSCDAVITSQTSPAAIVHSTATKHST